MPYLSIIWSLREAVSWIALRNPDLVSEKFELILGMEAPPRSSKASAAAALEELLQEILAGRVGVQARNVRSNLVEAIPARELAGLEFHIAEDIPDTPCGFLNMSNGVLTWTEPTVSARDVLVSWPIGDVKSRKKLLSV